MATEAQRLIGISLTKIAQSRAHRGGVSLHKNLLVATVLQKARYIFMEEAFHMVHSGSYCPPPAVHVPQQSTPQQRQSAVDFDQQSYDEDDDGLVALTPEEAGISDPLSALHDDSTSETTSLQDFLQPSCVRCVEDQKENVPPASSAYHNNNNHSSSSNSSSELTYLDLDKSSSVLRERIGSQTTTTTDSSSSTNAGGACLKRRRAVTEWETEEAVLSILPKRSRHTVVETTDLEDDADDSVFLDEAALFSDCVAREVAARERDEDVSTTSVCTNGTSSAMEIDRITSLVSIFSFGGLTGGDSKLSRSVSTPDLCSAQAKESSADALQQRPFLAMTV